MKNIFLFLINPKIGINNFILKKTSYKRSLILLLLIFNGLIVGVKNYILFKSAIGINLIIFIYNFFDTLFLIFIIWLVGKLLLGKSNFMDIALVTILSFNVFIIYNFILILLNIYGISLVGNFYWFSLSIIIWLPALLWFLFIWSKGLSIVEKFSETKVTLMVIISIVSIYFWDSFLYGTIGISFLYGISSKLL